MYRPRCLNWIRRNIPSISSVTATLKYLSPASQSPLPSTREANISVGNFVVAILLHPEETENRLISVQGQLSSWDEIISILEKLQGVKYSVKYTSLQDAEEAEEQAWIDGSPAAFRLNLRRCMGTGNAKLENVDNGLFPEVKVTTNLEEIAKKALVKKGLLK
jgi:hypothetical protein